MKAKYGGFLPEYVRVCPCVYVFLTLLIFNRNEANSQTMPVDIFAGSYYL